MRRRDGRWVGPKERDPVLAGLVFAFASAVERLRRRRRNTSVVEFMPETFLWGNQEDGGLAASRVPLRPPDRSGSGSAAMAEPTDSSDIAQH